MWLWIIKLLHIILWIIFTTCFFTLINNFYIILCFWLKTLLPKSFSATIYGHGKHNYVFFSCNFSIYLHFCRHIPRFAKKDIILKMIIGITSLTYYMIRDSAARTNGTNAFQMWQREVILVQYLREYSPFKMLETVF